MRQGDWADAAALWEVALGSRPSEGDSGWWWSSYADALPFLDRTERALTVCEMLREHWPHNPKGWRVGARLLAAEKGWRHALRALPGWRAAARHASSAELHAEFVLALLRAVETQQADREASTFLRTHGRDKHAAILLIEIARLGGDPRRILDQLSQLPDPRIVRPLPPRRIAGLLYDAGLTRDDATQLLRKWLGADDLTEVLDALYEVPRADVTGLATLTLARPHPRTPFTPSAVKTLLLAYTKDRSYPCCENFVLAAVRLASPRQIAKLARLVDRRFPRSRLALMISAFIGNGAIRLSAEDNAFAYRWRNVLPTRELSVAHQLEWRPWRRLVCAVMVRDEDEMLPHLLQHYQRMGVTSFIILDNMSETDPAAHLAGIPNLEISIVRAPGEFHRARHGMIWINEILEIGCCDWLLFVDCDEFLVFPGCDQRRLPALLDHFDSRHETAMFASMIDVYDEGYARGEQISNRMEDHRLFAARMCYTQDLRPPWISVSGGVRDIQDYLVKVPLVKASAGVRYINNHFVSECRRAGVHAALIHYKIYRDRAFLAANAEDIIAHSRVRHRTRTCVARHLQMARKIAIPDSSEAFHREVSAEALLSLGYMRADLDWRSVIPTGLPGSRLDAAEPAYRQIAAKLRQEAFLTFGKLSFAAALRSVGAAAQSCSRADVRLVLNAQLARVGDRRLRIAVLVYAAQQLGKESVLRRLLRYLVTLIRTSGLGFCKLALTDIAAAMGAQSVAAGTLMEAVLAAGGTSRATINAVALSRNRRGQFQATRVLFKQHSPFEDTVSIIHYLRNLTCLRDWNDYPDTIIAALDAGRVRPHRNVLEQIQIHPDEHMRGVMLQRFHEVFLPNIGALNADGVSAVIAACHLLGHHDEVKILHEFYEPRLPRNARFYFERLLQSSAGGPLFHQAWCVSLSKTGTTSFHAFSTQLGLFSTHWMNPVSGSLLTAQDGELFDFVSDSTVVYFARRDDIPEGRKVIATTRDLASWSRSFLSHFQLALGAPGASFDDLKETVYGEEKMNWGPSGVKSTRISVRRQII